MDDIIDTGGTVVAGAEALKNAGASTIVSGATHGVFSGDALKRLADAPISEIIVTNTLPLGGDRRIEKMTVLSIAPIIASAIKAVFEEESVSEIFHGENMP